LLGWDDNGDEDWLLKIED